jgi:hypothetical protein
MSSLKQYASLSTGRISTAKAYIDDVTHCLSGESCSVATAGISSEWLAKMAAEADDRLVYCDPLAVITKNYELESANPGDVPDVWNKDLGVDFDDTTHVFDAVLATKDKDRDGDIVHPSGMRLVEKMPLLWQHVWASPIGVMLKTIEKSADRNVNRYAIANTALGRDAKTLTKMGALRMSHGFIPDDFSPLGFAKNAKGESVPTGFEIKTLNVYESSLVSVPAGANAVVLRNYEKEFTAICDAFSGKKLESGAVQKWAGSLFDKRTKVFGGVSTSLAVEPLPEGEFRDAPTKSAGCGCQKSAGSGDSATGHDNNQGNEPSEQSAELPSTEKTMRSSMIEKSLWMAMESNLPGSYESRIEQIDKQLNRMHRDDDGYVSIISTFDSEVFYCVSKWSGNDRKRSCYMASYTVSDDKVSMSSEDPKPIEITPTVIEKQFGKLLPSDPPSSTKSAIEPESIPSPGSPRTAKAANSDPILELLGISSFT